MEPAGPPGPACLGRGEPLRLHEVAADADDPDPKALACYGLLRADTGGMLLRFVQGRPVSQVTEDFLAWACARLAAKGWCRDRELNPEGLLRPLGPQPSASANSAIPAGRGMEP